MEKGFYVELKWVKMCPFYNCDIFQLLFATLTNMEVIDLGFEVSATWFICDLGVEVRIREEYWSRNMSFLVKSQSMAQTHCRVGWRTNTHLPVTAVYYGLTAPMLQQPCVQYIHFHWGAIIGCFPLLRHKLCIAESFTRFDINQDPLHFFYQAEDLKTAQCLVLQMTSVIAFGINLELVPLVLYLILKAVPIHRLEYKQKKTKQTS